MFLMMINCGGSGTGVPFAGRDSGPATVTARPRQGRVAVAGDRPAHRAGVQQLM